MRRAFTMVYFNDEQSLNDIVFNLVFIFQNEEKSRNVVFTEMQFSFDFRKQKAEVKCFFYENQNTEYKANIM